MTRTNPLLIITAILFVAGPVTAQEIDHAERYEDCMAEAKTAPHRAFEMALSWRGLGGGDAAEHCAGAALIGLKQFTKQPSGWKHWRKNPARTPR